jgi:hypothetical protein
MRTPRNLRTWNYLSDPNSYQVFMLKRFWFKTDRGLGYGVTASSRADAEALLASYGYPVPSERVTSVTLDVSAASLDKEHVLPYVGPLSVRGVWYPRHNV